MVHEGAQTIEQRFIINFRDASPRNKIILNEKESRKHRKHKINHT